MKARLSSLRRGHHAQKLAAKKVQEKGRQILVRKHYFCSSVHNRNGNHILHQRFNP